MSMIKELSAGELVLVLDTLWGDLSLFVPHSLPPNNLAFG